MSGEAEGLLGRTSARDARRKSKIYHEAIDDVISGDHDQDEGPSTGMQRLLEHTVFQSAIGVIIAANAIVIGLETDMQGNPLWPVLEDTFLVIFAVELSLRLWAYGCQKYFNSDRQDFAWNVFDFGIVGIGLFERIGSLLQPAGAKPEGNARFFAMLMRSFRLLRILRIFRIFRVLKQLYLLAMGFFDAISSVWWVTMICGLGIYICGIMLTRLVGRPAPGDSQELSHIRSTNFGTIPQSMNTLFRLMAFPDLGPFSPVLEANPGLGGFFIGWVIFGNFTAVSVLTGVVTESMLEKSKLRQDEKRFERERLHEEFVAKARQIFQDTCDGSSCMDKQQLNECKSQVLDLCSETLVPVTRQDLEAMFDLVDYEGTGVVEIEELLYCLLQLFSELKPMAIMELRRSMVRGLFQVNRQVASLDTKMELMDAKLTEVLLRLGKGMDTSITSSGFHTLLPSGKPTNHASNCVAHEVIQPQLLSLRLPVTVNCS